LLGGAFGEAGAQAIPVSEDCVNCHLTLGERLAEPARLFLETDVHAELGFGCLACHGTGAQSTLSPAEGFLSSPRRGEIPEMCGRCHSDGAYMRQFDPQIRVDQVSEYWASVHGAKLLEGDDLVATCVDCHAVHQIRSPEDPESNVYVTNVPATCGACHSDVDLMAGRDIATNQETDYRGSIHGQLLEEGDLSAPVCNDCHGNHGAAPPGMSSVRRVCGQCHAVMAEYFDASGHEEIFDEQNLPGCATCHAHHAIEEVDEETLSQRTAGVCRQCHSEDDANGDAFDEMARVLDSLSAAAEHGRMLLDEAHEMGMEVSQALFELEDVNNAQTRARSAIHTFHAGPVREEATQGMVIAAVAIEHGEDAHEEHRFRRVGLGVFAGISLLFIAALLVKIREMDARMSTATEGSGVVS
jgi:hypothetical protein